MALCSIRSQPSPPVMRSIARRAVPAEAQTTLRANSRLIRSAASVHSAPDNR